MTYDSFSVVQNTAAKPEELVFPSEDGTPIRSED
jgi:hypothetical protein